MRKLKLQVQTSVDGFMAGPNNEMDWMTFPWTNDINHYVNQLTEPVDTILLGRKLAEGFIPHWARVAADPGNEERASGRKFTETQKVIFTRTLQKSEWPNSVLAKGDLAGEVNALKQKPGKDIIVYGGSDFVSGLIKADLIDEYHLFFNPAALGTGLPIFRQRANLKLVYNQGFDCGIVVLVYQRQG